MTYSLNKGNSTARVQLAPLFVLNCKVLLLDGRETAGVTNVARSPSNEMLALIAPLHDESEINGLQESARRAWLRTTDTNCPP